MGLENRLKEYRARLSMNQSELGKRAHVSRQTISLIERGDYSPSVTLAIKLAKIFEVTVEELFIYEEEDYEERWERVRQILTLSLFYGWLSEEHSAWWQVLSLS